MAKRGERAGVHDPVVLGCPVHGLTRHIDRPRITPDGWKRTWACVRCVEEENIKLREEALTAREQFKIDSHWYEPMWPCDRCGGKFTKGELYRRHCKACRTEMSGAERQIKREMRREAREQEMVRNHDKLRACSTGGICDLLHTHHDMLANDPERLSTEFILGMTCGEGAAQHCLERRAERLGETP